MENSYIAVDLGAGSGRVMLGALARDSLELRELHRFPNNIQELGGHERWNTRALFKEILKGLQKAGNLSDPEKSAIVSIGVDTWGLDYGLFDAGSELI